MKILMFLRKAHALSLGIVSSVCLLHQSSAADVYWDINGSSAGGGGSTPAGNWSTSDSNWSMDSTGASATSPWVNGNNAIFSAGTDASGAFIVNNLGVSVGNMTQEEGRIRITSGTLTLSNSSNTFCTNTRVSGDYDLRIDSQVAGTGSIVKTGTGILLMVGASAFSGGVSLNAGTLSVETSGVLGTGTLTLNSGNFVRNWNSFTTTNPLNVTGTVGVFEIQFNGNWTLSGPWCAGSASGNFNVANTPVNGFSPLAVTLTITGDVSAYIGTISQNALTGYSGNRLRFGADGGGAVTIDAANARFFTSGATDSSAYGIDIGDNSYGTMKMGELAGTGGIIRGGWSTGGNTTFEIGILNSNSKFGGQLSDNPRNSAGLSALNKVGTGALELTLGGGNSYSNGTRVTAGVLLVSNTANSATGSGSVLVSGSGTLGGTGRIAPSGTNAIAITGTLAPGGFVSGTTGGSLMASIGTLTVDQSSSSFSVLTFANGASGIFKLDSGSNDKVAIVGKAGVSEVVFNNTVLNFNDLSNGALPAGPCVLFQGDANTDYSGLTVNGSNVITAGLTIGTGLNNYPSASLKLIGNNIVLSIPSNTVPNAPSGLTVTGTLGGTGLSWTAASGADSYNIKRATTSGGPYTTIATGITSTTYGDTTGVAGMTYYYVVSAVNSIGEGANSAQVSSVPAVIGIGINFKTASNGTMAGSDLAGVVRMGNWNNMVGSNGNGNIATLSILADSTGAAVSGLGVSFTGGNSVGMFANAGSFSNDQALFNGLFDQFDGGASSVTVTGVPYSTYDVYVYRCNDGATRAGSITLGSTTYYVRGGLNNPGSDGSGYVLSSDTNYGIGTDIDQGNYVKFSGLTGTSFTFTFTAVNAGDSVMRNKIVGFQIVPETVQATVASAPPVPSVTFLQGNNQVLIGWGTVNTATSYSVQRSTDGVSWTTIANISPFGSDTYLDATAVNGTKYYYKVTAVNGAGQTDSQAINATPFDPATIRAIGVALTPDYVSPGMAIYDLGGVVHLPYWNNLEGLRVAGSPYSRTAMRDNTGALVAGLAVTYTLGNGGGSFVGGQTNDLLGNDVTLYSNGVDQFNAGTPGVVTITGIPYASYDVYVYNHDNGASHGGSVKVTTAAGSLTKYVRSGAGDPASSGLGYIESTDTTIGNGTDIQQGNYVHFATQSGSTCTIEFNAVNCGDWVIQRFRPCAVQIVSNTLAPVIAPAAAPDAPTGVIASAGNRAVNLNWNPSTTATGYSIKRSTSSGSGYSTIATLAPPQTRYCDLTASVNGTTYYYVITGTNSMGEGSASAEVSATPSAPAFTPQDRAVYQWSVPVTPPIAKYAPTADPERRGYLWVPPGCPMVRGLVVGLQNMLEKPLFEDPIFRQACIDANLGIVWISPGYATGNVPLNYPNMCLSLDPELAPADAIPSGKTAEQEAADELVDVLNRLAAESGHSEVQYAPILQVGHSAGSPFAWTRGVYASGGLVGRVFALLPYKGLYPSHCPVNIPILHVSNEWAENGAGWNDSFHGDRVNITNFRGESGETAGGTNNCLIGEYTQPGVGHYHHDSRLVGPLAMFIKKAAQLRIPSSFEGTSQPLLNPIDPTTGCLVDPTIAEPTHKEYGMLSPVAYADWVAAGKDPKKAYWFFDQEMAQAVCDQMNAGFSKKWQMIDAVFEDGSLGNLGPTNLGIIPYYASVLTGANGDFYFKVRATFLSQSPTRYQWHGDYLGFSSGPVLFKDAIYGGYRQTGPDTFIYAPDRGGLRVQGGSFVIAYHPGDNVYRSADRPIQIMNNLTVSSGSAQSITFPSVPNQVATNLTQINLGASASSGLPVKYWMVSGPYRNSGTDSSVLLPDTVPVTNKYPMRSVAAAWQWGSPNNPQVQTAGPVYASFWVFKDPIQKWQYETFGSTYTGSDGQIKWYPLPANASDSACPAGDGISNLLKYATGLSPAVSTKSPAVQGRTADGARLTLSFDRIADPNLTYIVEGASDLSGGWTQVWSSTGSSNIAGNVTVTDNQDISAQTKRFLRLRIVH